MAYKISIEKRALKELKSIPMPYRKKLKIKISSLAINPRSLNVKKLQGEKSIYRIRQGSYRVLFFLDDNKKLIKILKAGDRKDVYK